MKNFDIDISQNLAFEGELTSGTEATNLTNTNETNKTNTKKGGFIEGAKTYQDLVKSFTEYGADTEGYGYYEKYKDPQGKKKRILGLDPLVFIVVSFGLILASGIAIVVLKQKK